MCTSISKEAGAGFQLLMTDTTDILNRDYHANVRVGPSCVCMCG